MSMRDKALYRILVVDDEVAITKLLSYHLENMGFRVTVVDNGEDALYEIEYNKMPDLIILDWMLPKISGVELCMKLRSNKATKGIPIIMLSAKADNEDKLKGLDVGCDDYMSKPFDTMELLARVRAVLRRIRKVFDEEVLEVGDLHMNLSTMQVEANNKHVKLGTKEFRILQLFMEFPGKVYSREQLLSLIWDDPQNVDIRTVDVHINRLRSALGVNQYNKSYIRTVRGSGYSLNVQSDPAIAA